jgi:hypothetical protein
MKKEDIINKIKRLFIDLDITSKELSAIKKYGDMLPGVEIGKMEGQVEVSGEITKQEQHFIKQGEEFLKKVLN